MRPSEADISRLASHVPGCAPKPAGGLESVGHGVDATLSPSEIVERWRMSRSFLLQFIRTELGDDQALVELAERTLADGREGLELIGGERDETETDLGRIEVGLEVIVRTDGSRPAFLIRDDDIVETSSPASAWTALLTDVTRLPSIRRALGSVGRIDIVHPLTAFAGTAWLIGGDLVVTNRHVAQLFVAFDVDGGPVLMPAREPHVDFGHELKGAASRNRRPVTELVFCGARRIPDFGVDHSLLDVAVFRLGQPLDMGPEQTPLAIGLGGHLADPQTEVVTIGYPGRPRQDALGSVSETDRVLKLLFGKLWGYKRLAPGEIVPGSGGARMLCHDASTLGGNSGSLVMGIDSAPLVTGLHYGGRWGQDRVNWGHVLEAVLDEQGLSGLRYRSLRDLAAREGVELAEAVV